MLLAFLGAPAQLQLTPIQVDKFRHGAPERGTAELVPF